MTDTKINRLFLWILSGMVLILTALVILVFAHQTNVIQTSRYDAAYLECVRENTRHVQANELINSTFRGTRGAREAAVASKALIDVVDPLHNGKDGNETCTTYAANETALSVPSEPIGTPSP